MVGEVTAGSVEPSASLPASLAPLADVTRPAFELGVGRNLKARRTIRVIVRATSEDLWSTLSCRISIQGASRVYALRGTGESFITRGARRTLTLRIPRRALRAVRRGLRRHLRVGARLTIEARDAAGNSTVRTRTVRLTR